MSSGKVLGQSTSAFELQNHMMRLERAVLEGKSVTEQHILQLPQNMLQGSSLLLQEYGKIHFNKGQLYAAKTCLEQAVKGFGASAFPDRLCSAMCWLARVLIRLGEFAPAKTLLVFLKQEYDRSPPSEHNGELPHVLASGANLIQREEHRKQWYREAIRLYEENGKFEEAADAIAELSLYCGAELDDAEWNDWHRRLQRWVAFQGNTSVKLGLISDWLSALRGAYLQQWKLVSMKMTAFLEGYATANQPSAQAIIPYHYMAYATILIHQAALHHDQITDEQPLNKLRDTYGGDIQLLYAILSAQGELVTGNTSKATVEYVEFQSFDSVLKVVAPMAGSTPSVNPLPQSNSHPQFSKWRVRLFGGLQFERGTDEIHSFHWKRRKAQELCIYLLTQPKYTSPKDQVIESLQLGDAPEKAANMLYVTIHQLKQNLLEQLFIVNGVFTRGGFVMLREDAFDYVDVERYLTLIRVADQLWLNDRNLAYEMYEEAYVLYDDVLPELPYYRWLENFKEYVLGKQMAVIRKLLLRTQDQDDVELEESYYREWIRLCPYEELGYQALIRLLLQQKRTLEAQQLYDKFDFLCQHELDISPSEETRLLLQKVDDGHT